ncbi:hypothetical protein KIN20_003666 [Parelaphostrongylus tenuis]|uniref:RWD domain-containing protein n=1 Tax=Parelaphostrongylus tenuis TaxID=148309 RepID=A0AAD5LXP6_PARTN|nr:hypothetical protein KIN20_003666 [Parelaphostrongylus tenuis]
MLRLFIRLLRIKYEFLKLQMEADVEIEALRSIFGDEIVVETKDDRSLTSVRKKVRPNDEEGVSSASLIVEFELGTKYPEIPPEVRIINPRGISEQSHHQLVEEINRMISERIGSPIMFDILQYCADFILEHQHSSSLLCPICLCPMKSTQVSATPCDHYAHSDCLRLHVEHTRKQLGEKLFARDFKMCADIDKSLRCPICRVVIDEEIDPILPSSSDKRTRSSSLKECGNSSSRPSSQQDSHDDFDFDWEKWRQQQASLMVIYERQKEKGGIIDIEKERKKTLVTEDTVVVLSGELDGMTMEPSVSGASTSFDNSSSRGINADVSVVDSSTSLLDSVPTELHSNKVRSGNSSNRDGNRVRRFHGVDGGHNRKEHRGGHRAVFARYGKKNVGTMPDASVVKLDSTKTVIDEPRHSNSVHRFDSSFVSGARRGHRGSYHHQSLMNWKEARNKPKLAAEPRDAHD